MKYLEYPTDFKTISADEFKTTISWNGILLFSKQMKMAISMSRMSRYPTKQNK